MTENTVTVTQGKITGKAEKENGILRFLQDISLAVKTNATVTYASGTTTNVTILEKWGPKVYTFRFNNNGM